MMASPSIPRLLLVTDTIRSRLPLLDLVAEAVAGGVDAIYLRAGHGGEDPTAPEVLQLRERIGDHASLLVNDADLAVASGVGRHLRERDPIPSAMSSQYTVSYQQQCHPEARDPSFLGMTLGGGMTMVAEFPLIGRSVHSPEEATIPQGMDYLLAGHVYPSASKPGKRPLGVEGLRAIVAAAPCPVLAIGGITAERVAEVIRTGAHGVAVIGAIVEADDPRAAAAALRTALDHALQNRNHEEHFPMSAQEKDHVSVLNSTATIELTVNGKTVSVPSGATVHDFLASKKMTDAMAIVERNEEIVPRAEYGTTVLTAGDRLEVVHAVGGG